MHQADARSLMTGRIVDSYTNIVSLKLFSHGNRESHYVRAGMSDFLDTVHPQMRLATLLNITLWTLNMLLVFSTAALGIYLWTDGVITPGAIAIVMAIAIRLTGMSHWIMWEISSLFENIGTVKDGIKKSPPSNDGWNGRPSGSNHTNSTPSRITMTPFFVRLSTAWASSSSTGMRLLCVRGVSSFFSFFLSFFYANCSRL